MQALAASMLLSVVSVAVGEAESDAHSASPAGTGEASGTAEDAHGSEEEHELHPSNAILFLFTALVFGIVLRRAMSGFIIPYTGLLVVRCAFIAFTTNLPHHSTSGSISFIVYSIAHL